MRFVCYIIRGEHSRTFENVTERFTYMMGGIL